MPRVGLVAIVKNEAGVITRALDSARPLIDYALICDTGSTDGTQDIVSDWLQRNEVPGKVIEEPWQNFAHNRSFVLKALHDVDVDYAFTLDADETVTINGDPAAIKQKLEAHCYNVPMRLGATAYALPRITSNRMPFFYRGPVHEWPDCKQPFTLGNLDGLVITEVGGGARERDPNTYRKDALLFEQELQRTDLEPLEKTRYTFYLAQSWRDCGEHERALEAYLKRATMGGWHEEVYISLLTAARLREWLDHPLGDIVAHYRQAMSVNPKRVEAIYGLIRRLRFAGMCHEGYAIGEPGIRLPLHVGLFVETWIWEYGLLDEWSLCAYYAGHKAVGLIAMQLLLHRNLDGVNRERISKNLQFAAA